MSTGCRELCERAGEPLAGSAARVRTFVAISWPKRRWHFDQAARSEGLPPGLAVLAADAGESGHKLALRVFQRGPRVPRDRVELLCYRPGGTSFRAPEVALDALCDVLSRVVDGEDPGIATEPLGRELLVCTDGQHDDCCARFGRPVYRALCDETAGRGSPLRVAECSHLGGHRFAANLLALPSGDLYGRVEPRDARAIVDALETDRVLRYRYRGRLGADEVQQVADAFLAARIGGDASWQLEAPPASSGDAVRRVPARVLESGATREVTVRCELRSFAGPSSCGGEPESRPRWVAVALEEGGA